MDAEQSERQAAQDELLRQEADTGINWLKLNNLEEDEQRERLRLLYESTILSPNSSMNKSQGAAVVQAAQIPG
ncbi:hypothetical protein BU15DRAFT_77283 [Melanogaster broomeanus]|nr:hypothetical protein BU15DRAFT_77283 [Melanogaster broomeanus]